MNSDEIKIVEQLTYSGFIKDNGECLKINGFPIAEKLLDEIKDKQVSVRYWISDVAKTRLELQEDFLKTLFGVADVDYEVHYSELTGYLWTDEEINIGGHDLLNELYTYENKFVHLEIDIH